jgi:hypothetical protein
MVLSRAFMWHSMFNSSPRHLATGWKGTCNTLYLSSVFKLIFILFQFLFFFLDVVHYICFLFFFLDVVHYICFLFLWRPLSMILCIRCL